MQEMKNLVFAIMMGTFVELSLICVLAEITYNIHKKKMIKLKLKKNKKNNKHQNNKHQNNKYIKARNILNNYSEITKNMSLVEIKEFNKEFEKELKRIFVK